MTYNMHSPMRPGEGLLQDGFLFFDINKDRRIQQAFK